MGCDIHICTEVKKHANGDEKWITADRWKKNVYFGSDNEPEYLIVPIYTDRNYSLFAFLAGVRDYSPGNDVVSEPRGMPEDASPESKLECDRWGVDGHTHSWFTLKELIDFQKQHQTVKHSGYVHPDDAAKLDGGTGTPGSWCQGTSDKSWVFREWESEHDVLGVLIDKLKSRADDELWWFGSEDRMEPEKARIVFWFDN